MSEKTGKTKTKTTEQDEVLGYCYMNRSCTGGLVVQNPISRQECQDVGGGSWLAPDGTCYSL